VDRDRPHHAAVRPRKIMDRCDCLLAMGCRFGEVATGSYGMDVPEQVIHVDIDPEVLGRNVSTELAVVADAAEFLAAVTTLIEGRQPAGDLAREISRRPRECRARVAVVGVEQPGHAPSFLHRAAAPLRRRHDLRDRQRQRDLPRSRAPQDRPPEVLHRSGGLLVHGVLGAGIDRRRVRQPRSRCGDPRRRRRVSHDRSRGADRRLVRSAPLICVLRDGKHGLIAEFQKVPLNRQTCSVLPDYNLQSLSEAVGCRYFRVIRDSELDSVIPTALELVRAKTPVIVEVVIDYSEKTYFSRGVVATNFWRFPWRERLRMLVRALVRRLGA
jgi:acetolactate synthase-1/2/3 large subunit